MPQNVSVEDLKGTEVTVVGTERKLAEKFLGTVLSWVLLLTELTSDVEKNSEFTEVLNPIFFKFVYSVMFILVCTFLAVE